MFTRTYVPQPEESGFSLEQRLAGKATSAGVWFKITFYLLANVFTNSFSLIGLLEEKAPVAIIIGLCAILGIATIYANFISKTVVACDPVSPLHLKAKLQKLYERLNEQIKLNKELYYDEETTFILDQHEFDELYSDEIDLAAIGGKKKKFEIVMQIVANRYGKISLQHPTPLLANAINARVYNSKLLVATTSERSSEMMQFITAASNGIKVFNYDSFWEGVTRSDKVIDGFVSLPLWTIVKGFASLVLFNQGITTTISLLDKIPGFTYAPWYIQIGAIVIIAGLINVARIIINNILKGDRAILESKILLHKIVMKCCARDTLANDEEALHPVSPNSLQVGYLNAGGIVLVALASVGFTVYYNYTTARFYSPEQAADILLDKLQIIPNIENTPDWLVSIGKFIRSSEQALVYGQIVSALALSFLTACKSTLDRGAAWLYKAPVKKKGFCQKSGADKLFMLANFCDSATFGVNAIFNSLHTGGLLSIALFTGCGILVTNIIWGLETKNMKIAHAIIRSGSIKNLPALEGQANRTSGIEEDLEDNDESAMGSSVVSSIVRQAPSSPKSSWCCFWNRSGTGLQERLLTSSINNSGLRQ